MWIAALQARGTLSPKVPPLRFLMLQSARLPRDHSCKELFVSTLPLPTFVTFSEDDGEVKPHETRALIAKLLEPLVVVREKGGHSLMSMRAVSAEDQARVKDFFRAQR